MADPYFIVKVQPRFVERIQVFVLSLGDYRFPAVALFVEIEWFGVPDQRQQLQFFRQEWR